MTRRDLCECCGETPRRCECLGPRPASETRPLAACLFAVAVVACLFALPLIVEGAALLLGLMPFGVTFLLACLFGLGLLAVATDG